MCACFGGVCSHVVVIGLSVRLSWYHIIWRTVCSDIVSSAADVLEMSVVRGVSGVFET